MLTINTANAPAAVGPYSQAIVSNGMVYLSGQIAINPETGNVEATDIKGQTEQIIKNISAILDVSGSSFEKVVKTTCFLADMNDFAEMNSVYAEFFSEPYPARSAVAVKTLPKNALVEIEVVATISEV